MAITQRDSAGQETLPSVANPQDAPPAAEDRSSPQGAVKSESTGDPALDELLNSPIENLSRTDVVVPVFDEPVTTVARQESTVGRSPAAVYVLTNEMIRRSGARSLPDALRLVPGVNVGSINANSWSVSVRGFQDRFSNKLLVQIDGRTVYTPLFGGVFWDVQDVLLEDVDRIEVIRGPGATVWGANAVNGIVNVITKSAKDTQGIFFEGGGGNLRGFSSARVGGQSREFAWRIYGKWFDRDAGMEILSLAKDDWRAGRGGFRMDWTPTCRDTVTFQGDIYDGTAGLARQVPTSIAPTFARTFSHDQRISGGNTLMRWTRKFDDKSDFSLQFYYDRTERAFRRAGFREHRDTIDVDFQHRLPLDDNNQLIWGLGFRNSSDRFRHSPSLGFLPRTRAVNIFSSFVQDELTLVDDRLFFTFGSKFSHNDFTGFEIQPTARLLFTPTKRQSIWAAVSRAVRTPTRADDDVQLTRTPITLGGQFPLFPLISGSRSFESEELLAWEIGMRSAMTDKFFWDLSLFYNQYDKLLALSPGLPGVDPMTGLPVAPQTVINGADGDTYGFEISSTWNVKSDWTVRSGFSFLRMDIDANPGSILTTATAERKSPQNQLFLHSSWDLGCDWDLDLISRYVDNISSAPNYFEMDARLAWRPTDSFELAIVGRNLLDQAHVENGEIAATGVFPTQVRREVFGSVAWRY